MLRITLALLAAMKTPPHARASGGFGIPHDSAQTLTCSAMNVLPGFCFMNKSIMTLALSNQSP